MDAPPSFTQGMNVDLSVDEVQIIWLGLCQLKSDVAYLTMRKLDRIREAQAHEASKAPGPPLRPVSSMGRDKS